MKNITTAAIPIVKNVPTAMTTINTSGPPAKAPSTARTAEMASPTINVVSHTLFGFRSVFTGGFDVTVYALLSIPKLSMPAS